jgi:hypothetical protein
MDNVFYFHGETEPNDMPTLSEDRRFGNRQTKGVRDVTLMGFGVDHGRGAHAGNGNLWRTTVVAVLKLDYLKGQPITYVRLEGEDATELMASLATAIAIRERD